MGKVQANKKKIEVSMTREEKALANLQMLGEKVVLSYNSRQESNELKEERSKFKFFHCENHGLLPIGMFQINKDKELWRVKKKCLVCDSTYHRTYRKEHPSQIKTYSKTYYYKHHKEELERQKIKREEEKKNLTNRYVKQLYAARGIPAKQVTQKMIDQKRAEIILLREKQEKSLNS